MFIPDPDHTYKEVPHKRLIIRILLIDVFITVFMFIFTRLWREMPGLEFL